MSYNWTISVFRARGPIFFIVLFEAMLIAKIEEKFKKIV